MTRDAVEELWPPNRAAEWEAEIAANKLARRKTSRRRWNWAAACCGVASFGLFYSAHSAPGPDAVFLKDLSPIYFDVKVDHSEYQDVIAYFPLTRLPELKSHLLYR